ncbi:MAG TPA: hypothetical protein VD866_08100 [Urbifossiella sp.]|nr:hypothetical protein [Urbifossiella sp.]
MPLFRATAGRAAPLALVLALATGCGGGTGSVSGTVTYKPNGKTLTSGSVMVLPSKGEAKYGAIGPDGTYQVNDVPAGPCKVTVSSPDPTEVTSRGPPGGEAATGRPNIPGREPAAKAAKAAPPTGWFAIPDKYGDPNNSGLSVEVKKGVTTYNIELN